MRSFNLGAVLFDENFEGYRTSAELLVAWPEVDTDGVLTVTLESEDYTTTGQRQHAVLTFAGATAAAGIRSEAARANGIYIPAEATTQVGYTMAYRYKADAALAGMGLTVTYAHSFFGGSSVITPTCDGEWHSVTATITDFAESSGATGWQITATSVPDAGALRLDDLTLTRTNPLARGIDSTCPVCPFRWNGENGFRETLRYRTQILTARDGTETREQLRLFPRSRIEYEIRSSSPAETARIDAWLWAHHGKRVAVPRWVDALTFAGIGSPTTILQLTGGTTTDRMFEPQQRVMLWDIASRFETAVLTLVDTGFVQATAAPAMVWTSGATRVVPLLPARLDATLALRRPNPSLGIIPLAFDVEVAN